MNRVILLCTLTLITALLCVILPWQHAEIAERKYLNIQIDEFKASLGSEPLSLTDPRYREILKSGGPVFVESLVDKASIWVLLLSVLSFIYGLLTKNINYWEVLIFGAPMLLLLIFVKAPIFIVPFVSWSAVVFYNKHKMRSAASEN